MRFTATSGRAARLVSQAFTISAMPPMLMRERSSYLPKWMGRLPGVFEHSAERRAFHEAAGRRLSKGDARDFDSKPRVSVWHHFPMRQRGDVSSVRAHRALAIDRDGSLLTPKPR